MYCRSEGFQGNHMEKPLLFVSEHSAHPTESLHSFFGAKARRTAYGAVRHLGVCKGSASNRSLCLWAYRSDCPPVDCQRVHPSSKALIGLGLPIPSWRDLRSAINQIWLGRRVSVSRYSGLYCNTKKRLRLLGVASALVRLRCFGHRELIGAVFYLPNFAGSDIQYTRQSNCIYVETGGILGTF